jgi:hypothetical protein
VLLSFAQFEREVIGERIRDKVAASKRKGIWMGGVLPLGYDLHERRLVVNHNEAQRVRHIFDKYLELGCVRLLKRELDSLGIVSKLRVSKNGQLRGGKPFSRGALYHLLSNPVYLGEIRHKQERHPGLHQPIISRELWDRVQERLGGQTAYRNSKTKTEAKDSPLAGKLFDEKGEPLYVQGAANHGRRYRYYVSRKLVRGEADNAGQGWRVPAPEIEGIVSRAAHQMLADEVAIARALEESAVEVSQLPSALQSARKWSEGLKTGSYAMLQLGELTERVELRRDGIQITLRLPILSDGGEKHLSLSSAVPILIKRRGAEMRLVLAGDNRRTSLNRPLLRALARAHRWAEELLSGRVRSLGELAKRESVDRRSMRRLIRLAFLAPTIVEAIAEGHLPELTARTLTRRLDLPLLWSDQEKALRSA